MDRFGAWYFLSRIDVLMIKKYIDDIKTWPIQAKIGLILILACVILGIGSFVFESNTHDDQGKTPFYGIEFSIDF
jgi:hypothetical protein